MGQLFIKACYNDRNSKLTTSNKRKTRISGIKKNYSSRVGAEIVSNIVQTVIFLLNYGLGILSQCNSQCEKLGSIQNKGMTSHHGMYERHPNCDYEICSDCCQ